MTKEYQQSLVNTINIVGFICEIYEITSFTEKKNGKFLAFCTDLCFLNYSFI